MLSSTVRLVCSYYIVLKIVGAVVGVQRRRLGAVGLNQGAKPPDGKWHWAFDAGAQHLSTAPRNLAHCPHLGRRWPLYQPGPERLLLRIPPLSCACTDGVQGQRSQRGDILPVHQAPATSKLSSSFLPSSFIPPHAVTPLAIILRR